MPRETDGADSPEAIAAPTIDALDASHPSTVEVLPLANRNEAADRDGRGTVLGHVDGPGAAPLEDVVVNVTFPGTGRIGTTTLDAAGNYRFDGIALGTTVVVIASVPGTGATTARAGAVMPDRPSVRIDLPIPARATNPGFVNPDFRDGLNGWQTTGSVQVVPRGTYFDLPDDE